MSGLVLKLGPHERVLINGAVIENGDKRSRLAIMTPQANILRLRDAIATVVQQQTRSIVVRLREEVESVVRQAVYEAVADELAHRASAARGDAVQGGGR